MCIVQNAIYNVTLEQYRGSPPDGLFLCQVGCVKQNQQNGILIYTVSHIKHYQIVSISNILDRRRIQCKIKMGNDLSTMQPTNSRLVSRFDPS